MVGTVTYRAIPKNHPVVIPLADQWAEHPAKKLSPTTIQTILDEAEQGNVERMAELGADMLEREPTIASALETRALAVVSLPWDILPLPNTGEAGAMQARKTRQHLDNIGLAYSGMADASRYLTFDEFLLAKESANAYGFAPFQIIWRAAEATIDAFVPYEPRLFRFGLQSVKGTHEFNPHEIRILTEANPTDGEVLQRHSWVVHMPKGEMFAPGRRGTLRKLAYWYLYKNFIVRSMIRYAERTGEPLRLGKYEAGASPEDQAVLKRVVRDLGTDAAAVVAKGSDIEFIGHDRSTDSDIHSRVIALVNAEYSKLILGHQSATESTPGKLGNDEQKLVVQDYRIMADARAEESTINAQVIAPMCLFQDGRVLCYFKRKYEREEDANTRAERYTNIAKLAAIPTDHIYDVFDIPKPEPEDETTPAPVLSAFKRTAWRNASGKARDRMVKAARAQERVVSVAEQGVGDAQSAIENALEGLSLDKSLLQNKRAAKASGEAIRSALYSVLRRSLVNAGQEGVEAIGGDASLNRISFNLKDDPALKFLDWQAFSVSVIEGERITAALVDSMDAQLKRAASEGMTLRDFQKSVLNAASVGDVNSGHLETIFRTNLATAHAASKLFTMEKNPDAFPAWQFMAIMDNRVRDEHAALDGKIFSRSDTGNWPPLDYNCRCIASPVDKTEMESEGYEISKAEADVAPEFKNTAVEGLKNWVSDMRAKYPESSKLITQYEERNK